MYSRLVKQLTEKEGMTETLKAENQMLWVQKMNNLKNAATQMWWGLYDFVDDRL